MYLRSNLILNYCMSCSSRKVKLALHPLISLNKINGSLWVGFFYPPPETLSTWKVRKMDFFSLGLLNLIWAYIFQVLAVAVTFREWLPLDLIWQIETSMISFNDSMIQWSPNFWSDVSTLAVRLGPLKTKCCLHHPLKNTISVAECNATISTPWKLSIAPENRQSQ